MFFEYFSTKKLTGTPQMGANVESVALFAGILVNMVIDGVMIGIGSTLTVATGLL